jgi:hypothetical protein
MILYVCSFGRRVEEGSDKKKDRAKRRRRRGHVLYNPV